VTEDQIISAVKRWLDVVVVGQNLCPFARAPLASGAVHFALTAADSQEGLLQQLAAELQRLDQEPQIETTLLIHPEVLGSFDDYNQFLTLAEDLLVGLGYEGIYQIASFHPDYQFAGTAVNDAENFSNRSPYPLLHLLREESIEAATANHPDPGQIPERNIELLREMGRERLGKILSDCTKQST
jgi:uncharacterized protein